MADEKSYGDTSNQEVEGPVQKTLMNRIRAAKKKIRKIESIQQLVSEGKDINSDQRSTLNSKEGVEAIIDELERMLPLVNQAVKEEHNVARKAAAEEMQSSIEAEVAGTVELLRAEAASKDTAIDNLKDSVEQHKERIAELESQAERMQQQLEEKSSSSEGVSQAVEDVLTLLYFGQLFNQAKLWPAELERQSCISYDGILSPDVKGSPLTSKDLDAMVVLSTLMTSRKVGEVQSHKNAIDQCRDLAVSWIDDKEFMLPESTLQVAQVKQQLKRIVASEYFTILPKVAGADEMAVGMTNYLPPMNMVTGGNQHSQTMSQPFPVTSEPGGASSMFVSSQQNQSADQLYASQVGTSIPSSVQDVQVSGSGEGNLQKGHANVRGVRQQTTYQSGGVPQGVYPVQNGINTTEFTQPISSSPPTVPQPDQPIAPQTQTIQGITSEQPTQQALHQVPMQPIPTQQQPVQPQQAQYVMQHGGQQGQPYNPQLQSGQQGGSGGRNRGRGRGMGGGRGFKGAQYGRGGAPMYNGGGRYGGRLPGNYQQS